MNKKLLFSIIAIAFVGGLFSVAYAGPIINTITFAGLAIFKEDVQMDRDLNVDGDITGERFLFSFSETRKISYTPLEFIPDQYDGKVEFGIQAWLEPTGTSTILRSPAHTIPNHATITEFACLVIDISSEHDLKCILFRCPYGFVTNCSPLSTLGTTGAPEGLELSSGALSIQIDRVSNAYVIAFEPSSTSCDSDCRFVGARISYQQSGLP